MIDLQIIIWSLLMLVGFAGSALYSGMETGAYSLNRIRLHVLTQHGVHSARTLDYLLARPTTLLTTLLIGNNITNYLGAAALGVILETMSFGEWEVILLNALIVTPILFVVGETLPKDLFAVHCDRLMYKLAPVLNFSRLLFTYTGFVPLISLFSGAAMKAIGQDPRSPAFHPRRQVSLLVREGVGYGLLSHEQSVLASRVLKLSDQTVQDKMLPWTSVERLRMQDDPEAIWHMAQRITHSHVPVLERSGEVAGVLRINDALIYGKDNCPPIKELIKPAHTVSQDLPIRDALSDIKRHTAGLAIVMGKADQPIGIVTIKDLIESITGELRQW